MAQAQKNGGRVALLDAEFSYDPRYTASIGVDTSKLLVTQPLHLEAAMETLRELVDTNQFDLIVVDSVAAMAPMAEIEGEFLHDTMGLQARKLGAALRILTGSVSRSKTTVIFINQLREKIGVMFGKKETTPGGKALKFFASVRLEVSKGDKIVDADGKQIGNFINVTGVKNKVGFPWMKTSLELYYGKGLSLEGDAVDYGEKVGVLHKQGNTYMFGEAKLGVGREQAKVALEKDTNLFKNVQEAIKTYVNNKD
jgi:recombination protein RecA